MELIFKDIFKCCCNYVNRIRIEYNRELDKIMLIPCCGSTPKIMEEPFAFDSEYFINNYDECIKKYSNLDLINLNKYYNGTCGARPGSSRLCKKYNYNKNINSIENAISRNCNLNCKMCTFKNTYNKKELDLYNKLNDIIYNKNYNIIILTTNGEPFFDKKSTMEFIKKTNAKEIIIISNGQLLDHNDLDILKNQKNVKLIFSIDSINKDLYEKIRVNASFERIIDNIIYSKNIGLLDHINYTIQEDNLSELNDSLKYFDLLNIPVDLCIDSKTVNTNQVDKYINNINRYLKNDESI